MKRRSLSSLKLKKQTISNLDNQIKGGITIIPITYSIFFDCTDVVHTSEDYDGKKCDIATVRDSCFSACDDICNDF